MKWLIKKILFFLLDYEETTLGEFHNGEKCEIYNGNELKFIEKEEHEDVYVLSDIGFIPIKKSFKTVEYDTYIIQTDNFSIKCADEHIIIDSNYKQIFARNLKIGDKILTKNGIEEIIKIEIKDKQNMFDLELEYHHLYYTNGILSHNTITTAALFLWYLIFEPHFRILVLANDQSKAIDIVSAIKDMIRELPLWLSVGVVSWNSLSFNLENGSGIIAKATTANAGRGSSNNIVYVDEMAFIKDGIIKDLMKAIYPTITSGETSKFIITSTPKGKNYFWKMWRDAKEGADKDPEGLGKNKFKALFYHWTMMPGRDENFKQGILNSFPESYWLGEYECQFIGSGNTLLKGHVLEKLMDVSPLRKTYIQKEMYELKIYEEPKPNHKYILTYDPAKGFEQDYTAIHVWDISRKKKRTQVAVFNNNKLSEMEAPFIIKEIAQMYNEALIIGENNELEGVLQRLIYDLDYDNVYCDINDPKGRIGVNINKSSRPKALKQLEIEFEAGRFEIYDYDTIHELNTFVYNKGKYQADDGEHDDLVMSMALMALKLTDECFVEDYISDNLNFIKDTYDIENDKDIPLVFIENRYNDIF
jgi:hypothetical protein